MFIRSMVNGAVHFAGGVVLGVLSVFAAKGAADMMGGASHRGSGGGGYGSGGHGSGGHGSGGHGGAGEGRRAEPRPGAGPGAADPGSPPGQGFDKAAGI
jgi:hypothetical protein